MSGNSLLTPEVQGIVLSVMEGLSCPRSLTVAIMVRYGMWKDLVTLDLHVDDYQDSVTYGRAAYATKFLSKLEGRIDGVDPKEAALELWHAAEKQCARANVRLYHLMDFGGEHRDDHRLIEFLSTVRKKVAWLIGDAPPQLVEGHFGPGATISDRAGQTTVAHKLSSIPTLTRSALYYLVPWSGTKWAEISAERGGQPDFVRGNVYFQVPKKATIMRSCAKEASINAFFQRGYGVVMSKRLSSRGISISKTVPDFYRSLGLPDGSQEYASQKHIDAARLASIDERFATLDLSAASDTICTAFVEAALPPKWFEALSELRSTHTRVGKRWYRLEKFSSMGNGFTFELETTLFAAVCLALNPELEPGVDLFVFGDDIIVPTAMSRCVIAALSFLGLATNIEKTFIKGPFRESCGGDFYQGMAVRPYHLKELPNEPQNWIALANGISRLGHQNPDDGRLFGDLRRAWFQCLDRIPRHIRMARGPATLGDLVIHDDEKFWQRRYRAQKGYIRVYRPIRPTTIGFNRFDDDVRLCSMVYGMKLVDQVFLRPVGDSRRLIPMRGPVSGYKLSWISYG